jgi:hypothetical protein
MKKTLYIKIGMGIFAAFMVAKGINSEVFVANSPQVRPHLGTYMANQVKSAIGDSKVGLASLFNLLPEQKLKNLPLDSIAKGVYAKSNQTNSYTLIKDNEVEWREYTFIIKGKEVKIKVPQGQQPPPQELLEKIY